MIPPTMRSTYNHIISLTSILVLGILLLGSCGKTGDKVTGPPWFEVLDSSRTGIHFANRLKPKGDVNMLKYMYFYNGAGVGAGDFNNDGLIDLFFSSNQGRNRMYLNDGNMKFRDVTEQADIPDDGGWSTGVSVVDVNNDGLLDIYVSRVGRFESLRSHNQLLICQGINPQGVPVYKDQSYVWGVDFSGFSTQAAFLDYDHDGDLDMFLLNHSLRYNSTFNPRPTYFGTYDSLSGDRFFENEGKYFKEVTKKTGINSSIIGYGLGIVVSDINLDGWPDLYIGNDFHENDYLYINQHDGTFKEELTSSMAHTSQFSMGVDAADITNDGFPEVVSMDMLPSDPYILKRSLGEDEYNLFNIKVRNGYHFQYARNNLQLNRRNGRFSEIGLYSGMYATDWSWSALFADFDNDGLKDLFVSNGIPKRLNDIDYVNYISNTEIQEKIRANQFSDREMAMIEKFPQIKLKNKFFHNIGSARFEDMDGRIQGDLPTFSNGTVYADLDNDGDLDLVVNNIDDPAVIYLNHAENGHGKHLRFQLNGPPGNKLAVGSTVFAFTDSGIISQEKYAVKGFQSSMELPLQVGLGQRRVDSLFLVWPDGRYERVAYDSSKADVSLTWKAGLPLFNYDLIRNHWPLEGRKFDDVTAGSGLAFHHTENDFQEFDREPLIPHMLSTEGPALSVADINGDGREDVFVGSAKGYRSAVFLQGSDGKFTRLQEPALDADSLSESVDATWADMNGDRIPDLIVASGGNEWYGKDEHLRPRLYLNDGLGRLTRLANAFDSLYMNASAVQVRDLNGDGVNDIFLGGRSVPFDYGQVPRSYFLINDGKGHFRDATAQLAPDLAQIGFVTGSAWADIDGDGDEDLLLSLEWGGLCAFLKGKDAYVRSWITTRRGWWNNIYPVDIDGDGDMDLVAGNLGWNSRLKASMKEPVRMYYFDFDGNGTKEQIVTYHLEGREIPFANKAELEKQLPILKKNFLYAEDFAKASMEDLFGAEKLRKAVIYSADCFDNAVFVNEGNMKFTMKAFPWEAQLAPYRDAAVVDVNGDKLPDILPVGNYFESNVQMGRYDADMGTVLINQGKGMFRAEALNGVTLRGQVRHIRKIMLPGGPAWILARNNDDVMLISTGKGN